MEAAAVDPLRPVRTMETLYDWCSSSKMTDIVIRLLDKEFPCHRIILASNSPWFMERIQSGEEVINLTELANLIQEETLKKVIRFIYTGDIDIDEENAQEIIASSLFRLDELKEKCIAFLKEKVAPANCIVLRQFATKYSMPDLADKALQVIYKDFKNVASTPAFLALPAVDLVNFIKDDSLCIETEDDVVEALLKWIEHDSDSRVAILAEAFHHLRLDFCTKDFLMVTAKNSMIPVKYQDELMESIIDGKSQKQQPRQYFRMQIILIGGLNAAGKNYTKVWQRPIDAPEWQQLTDLGKQMNHDPHQYCCTQVTSGVVISGRVSDCKTGNKCQLFSVDTDTFQNLPDMPRARKEHGSALHKDKLYLLGGKDMDGQYVREVDVLDMVAKTWSTAANMSGDVCYPNVVVHGESIIVAGGNNTKNAFKYHCEQNQWSNIRDLPQSVKHASTVATRDKILLVGTLLCEYTMSTDTWNVLTPPPLNLYASSAVLHQGSLLVMGGYYPCRADLQKYDLQTQTWTVEKGFLPEALLLHSTFLFPIST